MGEEKNEEKKEEEAQEIVLKIDMHYEGCARKVARALKGFQGVEGVTADYKASKVVVKGKNADPIKVCERVEKKSGRKVEPISLLPKPPEGSTKEEKKDEILMTVIMAMLAATQTERVSNIVLAFKLVSYASYLNSTKSSTFRYDPSRENIVKDLDCHYQSFMLPKEQ